MKHRVGVLAGGDSPEREVSLLSGRGVYQALHRRGYEARLVEIETLDDLVPRLVGVNVAFNCLHGGSGEDGTVQLLLHVMGIPTIGSGPLACARAMDKAQAKSIFRTQGIPTPSGLEIGPETLESTLAEIERTLSFPIILKPRSAGSTLGVRYLDHPSAVRAALAELVGEFEFILAEPFIAGRELTVGILEIEGEDTALPVIEIRFPGPLFDYGAKYTDGRADFLAPAPLPPDVAESVQALALRAHHALDCRGFSRVDLRLSADGTPYVLEVNTLPGMTPLSDLPRAAALVGIGYDDLVERMLATAQQGVSSGSS